MNNLSKIFITFTFVIFGLGCSDDISNLGNETTEAGTSTETGSSIENDLPESCLGAGELCDPNSSCCLDLHCPAGASEPVCIPAM